MIGVVKNSFLPTYIHVLKVQNLNFVMFKNPNIPPAETVEISLTG